MSFVDNNFNSLLNIETAIVRLYRNNRDIADYDVMRTLDILIDQYRYIAKGYIPKEVEMSEIENQIYEKVKEACELLINLPENDEKKMEIKAETVKMESLVACLRKIRKSAEFWNKEGGRQGYLKYVNNFIH